MGLGIRGIEESSVYQDIYAKGYAQGLAEGRLEEARDVVLIVGQKKLGPPGEQVQLTIAAMNDVGQLRALAEKILVVWNWDELMTPTESPV